jgi:hypothetical protein
MRSDNSGYEVSLEHRKIYLNPAKQFVAADVRAR